MGDLSELELNGRIDAWVPKSPVTRIWTRLGFLEQRQLVRRILA